MINLLIATGITAIPILILSIVALALVFERLVFWLHVKQKQSGIMRQTFNLYSRNPEEAIHYLGKNSHLPTARIFLDAMQSEEGGRFFREQNRNMIIIAGEDFSLELPENFIWMTLNQLQTFLKFNNYLNIQARSLIAAIPFI